ncbi:rap guanine nucleotide exchange factor-like 1 [Labeo rohita]|uniref:Rap guanine nucleotide exchange factor-like 1 n=1 Tax=Labeo rohita TaxID=84645 RepID=A0A498MZT7_LABRO|nr:rap guanine nucleotide exchange factor-like 1 [Labeo rohita]
MPAGMKPLEKFLKKQTNALTRAGGFGEKATGTGASRRRASLSRVVPFFRETSPESGPAREVFSPETEEAPCWPSATADIRSPSLSSDEQSSEASLDTNWTPLPADTPENLALALMDSVAGKRYANCTEILLDDFMLTHPIFLAPDKFQQVLLQQTDSAFSSSHIDTPDGVSLAGLQTAVAATIQGSCEQTEFNFRSCPAAQTAAVFLAPEQRFSSEGKQGEGWPGWDGAERKLAVLTVAFRYLDTYRDLLQEEGDRSNTFPKELYLCAVQELSRFPELVEDVLKLQRWTEILHSPAEEDKESRKKQVRPLFRHFRRIDACLQPREAFRGSDEIFCRVYTPDHSYVTIRSRLSCRVGEILALVKEKLQYSEDQPTQPANLILVAVTSSGEKAVFRPSDEAVFTTLGVNTHLFACEPAELESLVEFVCYVFHGEQARWRPLNLELILQRCSEVQHWVATEILQCQSLPKRIQLLRKFIKIAALCKQQQDLLSFLALVLGLDNPAVSRLRLTWEGLPGKFRKQFQQFESIADPSRNHKSYRDLLASLRAPLIPFTPLLLKDLTFLHESCKTFHGELVNFEKMHKVAEMVRSIRRYRSTQLAVEAEPSPSHLQTKAYVRQLQVIDNQNLLFEMSSKLEPKDM